MYRYCGDRYDKKYFEIPSGIGVVSLDEGFLESFRKINNWTEAEILEIKKVDRLKEYYECFSFVMNTGTNIRFGETRRVSSKGAIMELLQNGLDAVELLGVDYKDLADMVSIKFEPKLNALIIEDFGIGLPPSSFMFAPNKKPDWMRGHFGEGLKLSLARLLLEGYNIYILTKRKERDIFYKVVRIGDYVYIIIGKAKNIPHKGTIIYIFNAKPLYDSIKDVIDSLIIQKFVKQHKDLIIHEREKYIFDKRRYEYILRSTDSPMLWVDDMLINTFYDATGVNSAFSYAIWTEYKIVSPDRAHISDFFRLKSYLANLLIDYFESAIKSGRKKAKEVLDTFLKHTTRITKYRGYQIYIPKDVIETRLSIAISLKSLMEEAGVKFYAIDRNETPDIDNLLYNAMAYGLEIDGIVIIDNSHSAFNELELLSTKIVKLDSVSLKHLSECLISSNQAYFSAIMTMNIIKLFTNAILEYEAKRNVVVYNVKVVDSDCVLGKLKEEGYDVSKLNYSGETIPSYKLMAINNQHFDVACAIDVAIHELGHWYGYEIMKVDARDISQSFEKALTDVASILFNTFLNDIKFVEKLNLILAGYFPYELEFDANSNKWRIPSLKEILDNTRKQFYEVVPSRFKKSWSEIRKLLAKEIKSNMREGYFLASHSFCIYNNASVSPVSSGFYKIFTYDIMFEPTIKFLRTINNIRDDLVNQVEGGGLVPSYYDCALIVAFIYNPKLYRYDVVVGKRGVAKVD